jgi:hypothetical protein
VYIYLALYYVTQHGQLVLRAQAIFAGLYILNLALVHHIYRRCQVTCQRWWVVVVVVVFWGVLGLVCFLVPPPVTSKH